MSRLHRARLLGLRGRCDLGARGRCEIRVLGNLLAAFLAATDQLIDGDLATRPVLHPS